MSRSFHERWVLHSRHHRPKSGLFFAIRDGFQLLPGAFLLLRNNFRLYS
jgi:hypothetical protein